MKYKDYYRIMGVSRDAGQDEIKRAYRKLARKFHPDVSQEPHAEERFKEVNEAYEVLKDQEKRGAYDQLGTNWGAGDHFSPPPGWETRFNFGDGGFTGADPHHFSDFFESLFGFGQRAPRERGRHRVSRGRGSDQHARISITLEEAHDGTVKTVDLTSPDADDGLSRGSRRLKVRIPKGVTEGQQIRLSGQGASGLGGGPGGDLYLEVQLAPHSRYRTEGRDIYLDLPVAPWEVALGAKVAVPTLGGMVDLTIPPGSQSGQKLRLKGRGLPGDPPGDQYLVLQVITPRADTSAARELFERMKREMGFNPRAKLGL